MSQSPQFKTSTTHWRASLKRNTQRTRWVILSFLIIYLCIGLLIDLFIQSAHYPQVPLSTLFKALLTFTLIPYAAIIAAAIAGISIGVTFRMYDKIMLLGTESVEVTAESRDPQQRQLYNVVQEMQVAAGLRYLPRIFIIEANYMNAFASGYSEKSAMVAITRGLLNKLDREELTAVIAHEISHIRHMDIKLTLTASVLSNLTLILLDVLFYGALFGDSSRDEGRSRNQLFIIILIIRFALPIITLLLMLYLSRTREYMADAGCVELMRNNEPLARALLKIQSDHEQNQQEYAQEYHSTAHEGVRRAAYLFDPIKQGVSGVNCPSDLFSTHPGIVNRLKAIGVFLRNGD